MLGRVAAEGLGVDALGLEIGGDFGGAFALVDEDEDTFDVDAVGGEAVRAAGGGGCRGGADVLGGGFADRPDGVGAGEHFVAAVRVFFDVDDAELDAPRDGVQVRGHEAAHGGEAGPEVGVQAAGDGGGAED